MTEEALARLEPLSLEELTPEQKALYDVVGRGRPRVTGPFGVWLRIPPIADAANRLTLALRDNARLDKRLFELVVLMVVRHWGAQYAWAVHEQPALKAGLTSETIEALRARQMPDFKQADERAVYGAVAELLTTRSLSQGNYDRLIETFGLDLTIEIISVAGMYGMVSTVLKGFDIPTANGEKPF
jgi:4-carboxymuconolactone decarboxylase